MNISAFKTITADELRKEPHIAGGKAIETGDGFYLAFFIGGDDWLLAERRKGKPILFKTFEALTRRYLLAFPDGAGALEYIHQQPFKKRK